MTDDLIDGLLYRTEGSDLDFKAEQYSLSGEDNETKSELVKDILAMANAWREGPAYILLGFKEEKPNPPLVVGISEFHDDAHFQQLVNSKVTPKIQFKYEVRPYRGVNRAEIRGFGSFALNFRPPRQGRNPKTGQAVAVPGKFVPHFKAGKELRDRLLNSPK